MAAAAADPYANNALFSQEEPSWRKARDRTNVAPQTSMFDEPTTTAAKAGPRLDLTALMYGGNSGQSTTPGLFGSDAIVGGA